MIKNWKNLKLNEKIGLVGILAATVAILVLIVLELFTENVPHIALSCVIAFEMLFSGIMNFNRQRKLAIFNLVIMAFVIITALIVLIFS